MRRERHGGRTASRHGVLEEDLRRRGSERDDRQREPDESGGEEDAHARMVRLARFPTIPPMITAIHLLVYSDDAAATRTFLRDVLGWPYVEHAESAPGWLIFRSGPSELGVHPTSETYEGREYSHPRHHSISLMCDDIAATVAELGAKGAEFTGPPEDLGFGIGTSLKVPSADDILLYQPKHPEAHGL
jgi:catechol 2,3-dioxygenase-like lactoylglutathione lyase family enzyme